MLVLVVLQTLKLQRFSIPMALYKNAKYSCLVVDQQLGCKPSTGFDEVKMPKFRLIMVHILLSASPTVTIDGPLSVWNGQEELASISYYAA